MIAAGKGRVNEKKKHRESVKRSALIIVTCYRLPLNTVNETTCKPRRVALGGRRRFLQTKFFEESLCVCVCQYLITLSYVQTMLNDVTVTDIEWKKM